MLAAVLNQSASQAVEPLNCGRPAATFVGGARLHARGTNERAATVLRPPRKANLEALRAQALRIDDFTDELD